MSGISFAKALVSFHIRRQNVIREKENCVHSIRKCNFYGLEGNERKETGSGGGCGGIHRGGFYIYNI